MKVKAIKNYEHWLTVGKVYDASLDHGWYFLIGDTPEYGEGSFTEEGGWLIPADAEPALSMILPADPVARKGMPITTGVLDYFPLALAEVAMVSKAGNDQHNPGQPLHWDKTKSLDHADCIPRHLIDRKSRDTDGMRHSAKLAWRALALLQSELEAERDAVAA